MPYPAPLADLVPKVTHVQAAWGNAVRDRLVHIFGTAQDRDAALGAGLPGNIAYTSGNQVFWLRSGDRWNGLQFASGWLYLLGTGLYVNANGSDQFTAFQCLGSGYFHRSRGAGAGGTWDSAQVVCSGNGGVASMAMYVGSAAPQIQAFVNFGNRVSFVDSTNTIYVPCAAASFSVGSADRFKERVAAYEPEGSVVDGLEVIEWDPVAPPRDKTLDSSPPREARRLGFRADNVAKLLPIAVSPDENGDPVAVDLAALLAVAMTELKALRARVAALEGS